MSAAMRAAVFRECGQPLALEELPVPEPGPREVRLRVAACGFCHTDLHYLDHHVRPAKPAPLILGHEVSGTVDVLGEEAAGWSVGDRVLVPAVLPCGQCPACRSGRENLCPRLRMVGNHLDGGFAEYLVAPAKDLVRLPPEIDLPEACVIADALTTPFHAVANRGRVRPGDRVIVVGCGGVGMNVVRLALLAGASVVAADLRPEKRELAARFGAVAVDPSEPDGTAKRLKEAAGGGADVAFDAVGTPETFRTALGSLARGGRLVVVGYGERPAELPINRLMFFEYEVLGSLGCPPVDYPRVVELVRSGRLPLGPVITGRVPLAGVNDAADRLRRGEGLRTIVIP